MVAVTHSPGLLLACVVPTTRVSPRLGSPYTGGYSRPCLRPPYLTAMCPHDAVADGPTWTQPSLQRASGHQQMTHSGAAKMFMRVASALEVHHLRGFCGRVLRP